MSEEEKEGYEELKKQYRLSTNVDCITTDIRNEYARTILNLIEKQQKQIDELQSYIKEYLIPKSTINLLYVSKDKIRAKIKSLEEKIHIVIPNEYNKVEIMNEFKNEGAVDILKELLEEE